MDNLIKLYWINGFKYRSDGSIFFDFFLNNTTILGINNGYIDYINIFSSYTLEEQYKISELEFNNNISFLDI